MSELKPLEERIKNLTIGLLGMADGETIQVNKPFLEHVRADMVELSKLRRAQPANEPLTLEQLREAKDGAPLWMAYEDGAYGEWGLVCYNRDSFTVVGLHEHHKPDDYGKTWLAYDHKPGGEQDA